MAHSHDDTSDRDETFDGIVAAITAGDPRLGTLRWDPAAYRRERLAAQASYGVAGALALFVTAVLVAPALLPLCAVLLGVGMAGVGAQALAIDIAAHPQHPARRARRPRDFRRD